MSSARFCRERNKITNLQMFVNGLRCVLAQPTGRRFEMLLNVTHPMAGCSEAQLAVRTFERARARVQTHVHFEAPFGREGGVTYVALEFLLTPCKKEMSSSNEPGLFKQPYQWYKFRTIRRLLNQ